MAKKLYLVFKMDEAAGKNRFLTVILSKPKNGLTALILSKLGTPTFAKTATSLMTAQLSARKA